MATATSAKKRNAATKAVAPKNTSAAKKPAPKKPVVESLLKPGQKAPSFKLADESGQQVSLASLKGKKLVLYFYPKDDTPGCTQESCDFRDHFARVKKLGVQVFGISRDSVASHTKFKAKYSLPFSLLADEEGKTCEAYGVWKEKSMYGRKYMGIERSTFLIDESGKIVKVYPKVSVTGHVDQVIKDIHGL